MDSERAKENLDQKASLGRRDLMKLGVGAGVAAAIPPATALAAQQGRASSPPAAAAQANAEPTGPFQQEARAWLAGR
jgi:hypothetical protein